MKILRYFCFYVIILLGPQTTRAGEVADNDTFAIYLNKSIESRNKDQIEESTRYLLEGKKYCKTTFQYATIFNSLGRNYSEISDYHTALNYYDSALAVTDTIAQSVFLGYLYNNYALAYTQLMKFEKAIMYYRKALLRVDNSSIGVLYFNISKCYGYLGKKDSTFYYLNKSYRNNVKALGEGSYYTMLTELEIAEISGEINSSLKRRILKGSDNLLKGKYFTLVNDFKQAERYLPANSKSLLKLYIRFKEWDKAISIIDSLRASFLSVDSKLFLQANERLIYKNAIDEFINTDTVKALKAALKSHANVLKENVHYTLREFPKNSYNYFDFDSIIYLFIVNKNIQFYRIDAGEEFQKIYMDFFSTFYFRHIVDSFKVNYRRFAESSNYLFNKLVPEVHNKMLIIPDGRLLQIPFEALLTTLPDTTAYPLYNKFPYLLQFAEISYDYILRDYNKTTGLKTITGLAPDISLRYAVMEVKNLRGLATKRLIGKKAKLAAIYKGRILHIAMHYDPGKYSLSFSDSVLDLNNLKKLPKDLVVLSTCYSGLGDFYAGEGTFSASRAFYMAGSESVIESLWPNNDKSAYMIFDNFYSQLSKGVTRSMALTKAKRQYLEDCTQSMSHPFFWANLRLFGNDQPLKVLNPNPNIITLLFFIGGIIIIILTNYLFRSKGK